MKKENLQKEMEDSREYRKAKRCLEEGIDLLTSPAKLKSSRQGDIPAATVKDALAKVSALLAQKGQDAFTEEGQESVLATITKQRAQHDQLQRQLKRRRKDFRLEDFPEEWPQEADVTPKLRKQYIKRRKRIEVYLQEINDVQKRREQYKNVLSVASRANLDQLDQTDEESLAAELKTTQKLLAAIQDKLTKNPLVEQRLKPQRVGAPPQSTSSAEGAADNVNLAFSSALITQAHHQPPTRHQHGLLHFDYLQYSHALQDCRVCGRLDLPRLPGLPSNEWQSRSPRTRPPWCSALIFPLPLKRLSAGTAA